jgi:hypothetical protein
MANASEYLKCYRNSFTVKDKLNLKTVPYRFNGGESDAKYCMTLPPMVI